MLKGAIAVVSPFAWDATLADLDRALHFGRLPHEWLWPLTRPLPLAVLNVGYNVWFFAARSSAGSAPRPRSAARAAAPVPDGASC